MNNTEVKINSGQVIIPLIVGLISAILVMYIFFSGEKTNFENLALGDGTASYYATSESHKIHCTDIEDAHLCLEGHFKRNLSDAVLWLGNSQIHGINKFRPDQESAPLSLFKMLQKKGIDLVTFSQPNASIQEHYVLFEYLKSRIHFNVFILPVVFDDMRENGIRSSLSKALHDPETAESLKKTDIGMRILKENNNVNQNDSSPDIAGVKDTIQESFEQTVNKWLKDNFSLWEIRPEIRGKFYVFLYKLRNLILGIDPTSKRHIIRGTYDANMMALRAMLDSARAANIDVIMYIAPLRNDIEIPYVPEQYELFKDEVERLALKKNTAFVNLEDLVPGHLWGTKESTKLGGKPEYDFMHFQHEGHRLLSNALYETLRKEYILSKR